MVNLYVTPDEVREYLGVGEDDYSDSRLQMLIEMKMDWIDKVTRCTWNGNLRMAREWHDMSVFWYRGGMLFGNGIPVHLAYRNIREFKKIEINMLSGKYDITSREGRSFGEWWCDYYTGVLYIQDFVFYQGGKELYVEYVYGRDDLPKTIKEWCLLLVVKDLILNERYTWNLEARTNSVVSLSEYVKTIDERINEIEKEYRGIEVAHVPSRVESYYIEENP